MLSLLDTRNSPGIKRVLGKCSGGQAAVDLINEATRRLLRRGDWIETVVPVFLCVYNGCLVMPRYVLEVRELNLCNREIPVRNGWWEFLSWNQNYPANWNAWIGSWCGQSGGLNAQGMSPVFQDIQGEGRTVRAYPRCLADIGKTMRIFGMDNNGQPLITKNVTTGEITQGALLTIANPFGSTSTFVRSIDYIVRDQTTCIVDVYAYNATTNLLEELAHYQPTETTPTYSRYKLNVAWPYGASTCSSPCNGRKGVVAMVKLRFVEAEQDYDLVMVPNVDALKLMIQAINREDANDWQNARELEKQAIEILNREIESQSPDDQFSVGVNTLGPGVFSNQCF